MEHTVSRQGQAVDSYLILWGLYETPPQKYFSVSTEKKEPGISKCKSVEEIPRTVTVKRCKCCICHNFDDNKDPSLWLVCSSETGDRDCCGLSCHIEYALQHRKAGCIELGQSIQLDGNYCCAACGKVIGILG